MLTQTEMGGPVDMKKAQWHLCNCLIIWSENVYYWSCWKYFEFYLKNGDAFRLPIFDVEEAVLEAAADARVESRRGCYQMRMVLKLEELIRSHELSLNRPIMRPKLRDLLCLRKAKASGLGLKQAFHEESEYKLPAMTIFLAEAMMLFSPLEAHAETCETTDPLFTMPILLAVALIGATVGGLLARQRKGELQRVNEKLRQINNTALRRQAKIESYAPSLSYAPVGKVVESEVIVDPKKQELTSRLKAGKSFMRGQNPEKGIF